jgi:hypothetical protein
MELSEHSIQTKVVQFVRAFHPDVLICSIPNGANTTSFNRVKLTHEGLLSGMPDLFIAEAKHGFNGMFLEMKTTKGKESNMQKKIRKQLNDKGYLVYVANSHLMAIDLINQYLVKSDKL